MTAMRIGNAVELPPQQDTVGRVADIGNPLRHRDARRVVPVTTFTAGTYGLALVLRKKERGSPSRQVL
jgi:hypothetical protein